MNRCRFCGEKVAVDAHQCEHCGKTIKAEDPQAGVSLTNIDSWENKSIPAWVMYAVVAFFVVCGVLVMVKGCEDPAKPKEEPNSENQTAVLITSLPRFALRYSPSVFDSSASVASDSSASAEKQNGPG